MSCIDRESVNSKVDVLVSRVITDSDTQLLLDSDLRLSKY